MPHPKCATIPPLTRNSHHRTMAAEESKGDACCPAGSHPELILDESRQESLAGKVVTLSSGLVTYQVPAPDADCKKAIVLIYDVHGFSGGRIKGVCDAIAAQGFHVVMPDFYGESAGINDKGGFSSPEGAWCLLWRLHRASVLTCSCFCSGVAWLKTYDWTRLEKNLKEVQTEVLEPKGITSVGAVGFCWGAYVVFKMSAAGMIRAGASCHPSLQIGPYLFEDPIADQAAAAKCPMLLCPAKNDPKEVQEGGVVQTSLTERDIACKVRAFPDMQHGFVPRGDATVPEIKRDVQLAVEEVGSFLSAHL